MKSNLACFDLDGTLFDTTDVNFRAYAESLRESGFTLSREHYTKACHSRSYREFLPPLVNNDPQIVETVHLRKIELYDGYAGEAIPNIHLFNIISAIRSTYHTVVVTTASRACAKAILKNFNYLDFFDLLITGDDVTKSKPHPECYLKSMDYFGTDKENTLIFEDSPQGIEAARKSGANVIIVSLE